MIGKRLIRVSLEEVVESLTVRRGIDAGNFGSVVRQRLEESLAVLPRVVLLLAKYAFLLLFLGNGKEKVRVTDG